MAKQPATEVQLLRSQKVKLIEILSSDADFVLQHADSRFLLSPHGYQLVKACHGPSEKVTELLDHILMRGPEAVKGLLELLKHPDLQETFPRLDFIMDLQVNTLEHTTSSGVPELQEPAPSKQIEGSHLVKEKQLMIVARAIGKNWRMIGRLDLNISTVKLEQIEEDHSTHVERVFAMLSYWKNCQRELATAAHLHYLLSEGEVPLPAESIEVLMNSD